MNDGICIMSAVGSFRCRCQGFEGPHCETSQLDDNIVSFVCVSDLVVVIVLTSLGLFVCL